MGSAPQTKVDDRPAVGPASPAGPPAAGAAGGLSVAQRQRLQTVFDHGKKSLEKGDYAYAHDLFSQCVSEDPGALVYLQHFRANLSQMHPQMAASKGGGLPGFGGPRATVVKHATKGQWFEAFTAGCKALKKVPGDLGVLRALASGCGELGHGDCQLYYLRWALDLAPTDVDTNVQAAEALEAMGEFDQAIGCWTRVQQQRPADEAPAKAIKRLTVERTIDRGQYDMRLLNGAAAPQAGDAVGGASGDATPPSFAPPSDVANAVSDDARAAAAGINGEPPPDAGPDLIDSADAAALEQQLRDAVQATPTDPAAYVRLADFYEASARLHDAERLLNKALKVAGGMDLGLLERLEEVHLRRLRERAAVAQKRAERQGSEAARRLAEQMLREANLAEAEVFGSRARRDPNNARLQYDYGLRLKRVGNHREAIQPLQAARSDTKRRAEIELHLGECFQHIEQHALAVRSYQAAIAACSTTEWTEVRKLALYRAGVLAMGLKDVETAERHLTELAAADFGYRDVGDRLDKLARIGKDA